MSAAPGGYTLSPPGDGAPTAAEIMPGVSKPLAKKRMTRARKLAAEHATEAGLKSEAIAGYQQGFIKSLSLRADEIFLNHPTAYSCDFCPNFSQKLMSVAKVWLARVAVPSQGLGRQ